MDHVHTLQEIKEIDFDADVLEMSLVTGDGASVSYKIAAEDFFQYIDQSIEIDVASVDDMQKIDTAKVGDIFYSSLTYKPEFLLSANFMPIADGVTLTLSDENGYSMSGSGTEFFRNDVESFINFAHVNPMLSAYAQGDSLDLGRLFSEKFSGKYVYNAKDQAQTLSAVEQSAPAVECYFIGGSMQQGASTSGAFSIVQRNSPTGYDQNASDASSQYMVDFDMSRCSNLYKDVSTIEIAAVGYTPYIIIKPSMLA